MSNIKNNATAQETRRKLMNAAGEVFAESGLHAATIKQITGRAGVNIAAVNYHFSDKFELYALVVRSLQTSMLMPPPPATAAATPEARFHGFIDQFMRRLMDRSRPAWHRLLFARELAQPTAALDTLVAEIARPVTDRLAGILRDLLGEDVSDRQVNLSAFSILGLCLSYLNHGAIITRLGHAMPQDELEPLIQHITEFSLHGVKSLPRPAPALRPRQRHANPRQPR
jgi:AcrR family transcriptional regulator